MSVSYDSWQQSGNITGQSYDYLNVEQSQINTIVLAKLVLG